MQPRARCRTAQSKEEREGHGRQLLHAACRVTIGRRGPTFSWSDSIHVKPALVDPIDQVALAWCQPSCWYRAAVKSECAHYVVTIDRSRTGRRAGHRSDASCGLDRCRWRRRRQPAVGGDGENECRDDDRARSGDPLHLCDKPLSWLRFAIQRDVSAPNLIGLRDLRPIRVCEMHSTQVR